MPECLVLRVRYHLYKLRNHLPSRSLRPSFRFWHRCLYHHLTNTISFSLGCGDGREQRVLPRFAGSKSKLHGWPPRKPGRHLLGCAHAPLHPYPATDPSSPSRSSFSPLGSSSSGTVSTSSVPLDCQPWPTCTPGSLSDPPQGHHQDNSHVNGRRPYTTMTLRTSSPSTDRENSRRSP